MAKLSSYRNIYSGDFDAQYKGLIDPLATTVNAAFNELYTNFNNGITLADNIAGTLKSITLTVDASGVPTSTAQFSLNTGQTTVSGLSVIDAGGATNSSLLPTGGIFVSFVKSNNNVVVQNVKGLQANSAYTLKIMAWA